VSAFRVGQRLVSPAGHRIEIVGADAVCVSGDYLDVVAYRYEGRSTIHIVPEDDMSGRGWKLIPELKIGMLVRYKDPRRAAAGRTRREIAFVSDRNVMLRSYTEDGLFVQEWAISRRRFEEQMEVVPE